MPRYLFGPIAGHSGLAAARAAGDCRTVGPGGADVSVPADATWAEVVLRLPDGWEPDFVAVWACYTTVPGWVWDCPLPLVALCPDWNLLGHTYRALARRFDRLLVDRPGVAAFARHGLPHARAANLFGVGPEWRHAEAPVEKDLDVVFVGNLHPAVQRDRLPWLGRLARLSDRFRIHIATGVHGADYRRLLRRAKVAFNRSIRGECNQRVAEAVAADALLLQEAGNAEVAESLTPGVDYLEYTAADFEAVVERAVTAAADRQQLVANARTKLPGLTFEHLWDRAAAEIAADLPALQESAARRRRTPPTPWTAAERAWVESPAPADRSRRWAISSRPSRPGTTARSPSPVWPTPWLAPAAAPTPHRSPVPP